MTTNKYMLIKDGKNNSPKGKTCNHKCNLYWQILLFCAFMVILFLYKITRNDFQHEISPGYSLNVKENGQTAKNMDDDDYDADDDNDGTQTETSTMKDKNSEIEQKYFVHTEECVIPYVNPATSGAKIIYDTKLINCTNDEAFIESFYDVNSKQYILHINYEVAQMKFLNSSDELSCCYKEIVRAGRGANADKGTKVLDCINFHQDFYVPEHINGIIVQCSSVLNQTVLQEDAFSFVQYKNVTTTNQTEHSNIRKPSVLMIGIDSVSRINVRRVMPRTAKYLIDNDWFELQGYNKIGDNTYPNLMAFLAGYDHKGAYKICKPTATGGLDKCDFVWKIFKNNGYRTAYAEDSTGISTFVYLKKGFLEPPTDYYLRPFFKVIEHKMKGKWTGGAKYCVGRRRYAEYIYDHAVQFGQRYNDDPIFGLFWTNSFSHNYYHVPAQMDERMRTYLQELEDADIFDNSIVIFLSDHGMRWGKLNGLRSGFLEPRLPMLFIWLPLWFRNKYPEYVKALEINRNRLTSPFDLYMTLKHIVKIGNPELEVNPAQGCEKCQTLFAEIPDNRTCEDAGITPYWCTCNPFKRLKITDKTIKTVIKLVINKMNEYVQEKGMGSLCQKITLRNVTWAGRELILHPSLENKSVVRYKIEFIITEKNATFEARPAYIVDNQTVNIDVEEIARTNLYGNDSSCIKKDGMMKKYCICKIT